MQNYITLSFLFIIMLFKNAKQIIENGKDRRTKLARKDILSILSEVVKSVDPYRVTHKYLEENIELSSYKSIYMVAFGKASIRMAQAACDLLPVEEGVVITNEDKIVKARNVHTFTGDHPIPTLRNIKATEKAIEVVEKCKEEDLLLVLISGGGSALLCKPRVPLEDMQTLTDMLLKSGADITELNTIRKHLSFVKGGQLAKLAGCEIISCIISDVVGDPIEFIASGPTAPDTTTFEDAKNILIKYDLWNKVPESVKRIINMGLKGELSETPKPGDEVFNRVKNVIVANNSLACESAKRKAEKLGYKAKILSTTLTGEARKVGKFLVKKAMDELTEKEIMVAGGETTVRVRGKGKGGRNQEMVLSTIEMLKDSSLVFASFATDGVDGNSDAAGAIADSYTLERSRDKGMRYEEYLENNDSYHFFKNLNDLLITGPTGTNVMDVQILLHC